MENSNPRFQSRKMKQQKSSSDHTEPLATGLVSGRRQVAILIPPLLLRLHHNWSSWDLYTSY